MTSRTLTESRRWRPLVLRLREVAGKERFNLVRSRVCTFEGRKHFFEAYGLLLSVSSDGESVI